MIDRTRLAISGAVLAIVAFAANAVIAWTDYRARSGLEQELRRRVGGAELLGVPSRAVRASRWISSWLSAW